MATSADVASAHNRELKRMAKDLFRDEREYLRSFMSMNPMQAAKEVSVSNSRQTNTLLLLLHFITTKVIPVTADVATKFSRQQMNIMKKVLLKESATLDFVNGSDSERSNIVQKFAKFLPVLVVHLFRKNKTKPSKDTEAIEKKK